MGDGINNFLDSAGKTMEVFPKLYDDGLQGTVKEAGKIIERIPKAINAAFTSLDIWIEQRNFNLEETKQLLSEKLKDKNPDNIVPPAPYVAVPALQAISYSMGNDDLRNLYANLLAKSMQKDTKELVHPSFVEIIKQLSPADAKMLFLLANDLTPDNSTYPLINVIAKNNKSHWVSTLENVINHKYHSSDNYNLSLDNLSRLKLILIYDDRSLVEEELYSPLIEIPAVQTVLKEIETGLVEPTLNIPEIKRGSFHFSDLGLLFVNTCVSE